LGMRIVDLLGLDGTLFDPARPWNKHHAAPLAPAKSFRALWGKRNGAN
jgi:hypothetical protein